MKDSVSYPSFLEKQEEIELLFQECPTPDAKYKKIIDIGRDLPPYPENFKAPDKIVPGCQSIMYLHAYLEEDRVYFLAHSEALISAGLAALLLKVYSGEPAHIILKQPPLFLEKIGIATALSPSRSNGLASLFLKMKQEALKFL